MTLLANRNIGQLTCEGQLIKAFLNPEKTYTFLVSKVICTVYMYTSSLPLYNVPVCTHYPCLYTSSPVHIPVWTYPHQYFVHIIHLYTFLPVRCTQNPVCTQYLCLYILSVLQYLLNFCDPLRFPLHKLNKMSLILLYACCFDL